MAVAVSAVALALVLARPHELRVEAGDARAHRMLRSFPAPFARQSQTGRWSGPESSLVLHGVGAGQSVVTLGISGGMPGRPQTFALVPVGGGDRVHVEPATFTVLPGVQEYRVRVTVARWPPSVAPVELAVRTTPYRRGAEGSALGVRVIRLSVQAADGPGARFASALPVAVLWGWTLALAAFLLMTLGRRLAPSAHVDRVAAAVVGGAGLLLCVYAWRDHPGFAWTLPPFTAALALVTVALLLSAAESAEGASPGRAPSGRAVWPASFGALVVLYVQRGGGGPALIVLIAALAWLAVRVGREGATTPAPGEDRTSPLVWLGLAAVAVAAVAMRFTDIRDLPYGLWRDDARYGLVALRMIEDPAYRPAYVPEVVSLPGLGLRMLGLGLQVWGIASWSMRTVPALAGALTVVALFGLARRLTGRADVALLAAAFLAASSWHVTVSRITSPAAIHPLFELTGLWCLAEGWGAGRRAPVPRPWRTLLLLAGGAFVGVSLQTYHSGRSSPLVAAALIAAFWTARRGMGRRWRDLLCVAAGFAVAGAPLLAYAWSDSRNLNARAGAVFLPAAAAADATPPLAALDASLGRHLLMFHVSGDFNGRRNVPRRPMLDPVTGLGFLAGLLALWRARSMPGARFLLGALVLGLVPSALAVEGPHALRAIGAASFSCLIAAIGWRALADRLSRPSRAWAAGAVAAAALAFNAWTYFVVARSDERVWGAFYTVETAVGSFVRDHARREGPPAAAGVYLSREIAASSVVEFLTHGLPVSVFDTALADPPAPGARFVVARESDRQKLFAIAAERALGPPEVAGFGPLLPDRRTPAFTLYRLP